MFRSVLFALLLCLNASVWALPSWEEYRKPIDKAVWKDHQVVDRLFHQMYQKEKEYDDTHYVAYTAMDPVFFVYQTLLAELDRQAGLEVPDTFFYLRDWCDAEQYATLHEFLADHPQFTKPEALLDRELLKLPCDVDAQVSKHLISASASCQLIARECSATHVFFEGMSVCNHFGSVVLDHLLTDRLLDRGFDPEEIRANLGFLHHIMPESENGSGIMIQILIDRNAEISAMGYPSNAGGYLSEGIRQKERQCFQVTNLFEYYKAFSTLQDEDNIGWRNPDNQIRLIPGALTPENCRMYRYWDVPAEELEEFVQEIRQVAADLLASKN